LNRGRRSRLHHGSDPRQPARDDRVPENTVRAKCAVRAPAIATASRPWHSQSLAPLRRNWPRKGNAGFQGKTKACASPRGTIASCSTRPPIQSPSIGSEIVDANMRRPDTPADQFSPSEAAPVSGPLPYRDGRGAEIAPCVVKLARRRRPIGFPTDAGTICMDCRWMLQSGPATS